MSKLEKILKGVKTNFVPGFTPKTKNKIDPSNFLMPSRTLIYKKVKYLAFT